jgi:site-specific DNA-methyltransferase (adenine-specific)
MGRKPLEQKTVAGNVLEWGTGGINIDDCRIEYQSKEDEKSSIPGTYNTKQESIDNALFGYIGGEGNGHNTTGRFPANVILDEVAGKELDKQSGDRKSSPFNHKLKTNNIYGNYNFDETNGGYNDNGGASRFFYCPKTSKSDRNEGCDELDEKGYDINQAHNSKTLEERYGLKSKNNHPTVKPTDLMRYLVRLVTPKGGTVLDPFMGSCSTGKGAVLEGMNFVGIERETEYYEIAKNRISIVNKEQHHEKFFE